MILFECSRGDTGFSIRGILNAKGSKLPNLTGATVRIWIGEPGAYAIADAPVEVIDALTRQVNYDLNPADLGGAAWTNVPAGGGTYRIRFKVTRADGGVLNVPSREKSRMYIAIREP